MLAQKEVPALKIRFFPDDSATSCEDLQKKASLKVKNETKSLSHISCNVNARKRRLVDVDDGGPTAIVGSSKNVSRGDYIEENKDISNTYSQLFESEGEGCDIKEAILDMPSNTRNIQTIEVPSGENECNVAPSNVNVDRAPPEMSQDVIEGRLVLGDSSNQLLKSGEGEGSGSKEANLGGVISSGEHEFIEGLSNENFNRGPPGYHNTANKLLESEAGEGKGVEMVETSSTPIQSQDQYVEEIAVHFIDGSQVDMFEEIQPTSDIMNNYETPKKRERLSKLKNLGRTLGCSTPDPKSTQWTSKWKREQYFNFSTALHIFCIAKGINLTLVTFSLELIKDLIAFSGPLGLNLLPPDLDPKFLYSTILCNDEKRTEHFVGNPKTGFVGEDLLHRFPDNCPFLQCKQVREFFLCHNITPLKIKLKSLSTLQSLRPS